MAPAGACNTLEGSAASLLCVPDEQQRAQSRAAVTVQHVAAADGLRSVQDWLAVAEQHYSLRATMARLCRALF